MKKQIISLVGISTLLLGLFVSIVFAGLDEIKSSLITNLENVNQSLVNKVSQLSGTLGSDKSYLMLKGMGKIDISDLNKQMLTEYFLMKNNILTEYNTISSSKTILSEKKQYGLITDNEYNTELNKINSDITSYNTKYLGLITGFNAKYGSSTGAIYTFTGNLAKLKTDNVSLISDLTNKETTIRRILTGYQEFDNNINKIKNLYEINYDNIYSYINDVKTLTTNNLKESLENLKTSYLNKYKNLDYYNTDISSYVSSMLTDYGVEVETYLGTLIKSFYQKGDYDFIVVNYKSMNDKYMNGTNVRYDVMIGSGFDDVYNMLDTRLIQVNQSIKVKFDDLNNPGDIADLNTTLNQKITQYYNNKRDEKKDTFTKFLDKEVELLQSKTSKDLESYNVIKQRIEQVNVLTGDSDVKYRKLMELRDQAVSFASGAVDRQLKTDMGIKRWEIEIKMIDIIISNPKYDAVRIKYPGIDISLAKVFAGIQKDAVAAGKMGVLDQKIVSAFAKIDVMLSNGSIPSNSAFLLLKIKRAMIVFKYIK